MKQKAELILVSDCIFDAVSEEPFSGYLAIAKDRILDVGKGPIPEELCDENTRIVNCPGRTITPGLIDVHCFFTGYVVRFLGEDLGGCGNEEEVFAKLTAEKDPILGHGLDFRISCERLDAKYPDRAVILFHEGCETCSMNTKAIDEFGFTPERCYPEAYVRIFPYILGDHGFIAKQFRDYMRMMNSRGITSVKEMGFDDFYSFTEVLEQMEKDEELTLRVNFMSQPVAEDMDLEYGIRMRERYHSEYLRFSGFNQMTDGSVSEYNAELKKPYENDDSCCHMEISWDKLKADTLKADENGFRFSLHAQGDGAIARVLDIYEECERDEQGKVKNRHAITDLEFSDPKDLERMGRLGVIAEIYPQIQSIANRKDKLAMIEEKIGRERGKYYWNRRKMADSGVTISCGTDLPLLIDDIPESIYHAVGAYFPEGGEPFNEENTLTISELLKGWSCGGACNLSMEDLIGTLEAGKKADIAVFDGDLFRTVMNDIRDISVAMTIFDGKIVYEGDEDE